MRRIEPSGRDPLSLDICTKIDALCESIAQRDQLGEDIQQELRGHIEDKILAYRMTGLQTDGNQHYVA